MGAMRFAAGRFALFREGLLLFSSSEEANSCVGETLTSENFVLSVIKSMLFIDSIYSAQQYQFFGATMEHNYRALKQLNFLKSWLSYSSNYVKMWSGLIGRITGFRLLPIKSVLAVRDARLFGSIPCKRTIW